MSLDLVMVVHVQYACQICQPNPVYSLYI